MAVLVVPHVVQISARGTVSGRPWASVWHVENAASWWTTGAPVQDVVRDFANNWQDHIMSVLTNTVAITAFDFVSLHTADGSTGSIAPDPAKRLVGQGVSEPAPPNCAILVRKLATSGRGRRSGRAYLPGVGEAAVSAAGVIAAATLTSINSALTAFWNGIDAGADMNESERHLVVVHRPPAARQPGEDVVQGSSSRVSSLAADSLIATQRRRLRG